MRSPSWPATAAGVWRVAWRSFSLSRHAASRPACRLPPPLGRVALLAPAPSATVLPPFPGRLQYVGRYDARARSPATANSHRKVFAPTVRACRRTALIEHDLASARRRSGRSCISAAARWLAARACRRRPRLFRAYRAGHHRSHHARRSCRSWYARSIPMDGKRPVARPDVDSPRRRRGPDGRRAAVGHPRWPTPNAARRSPTAAVATTGFDATDRHGVRAAVDRRPARSASNFSLPRSTLRLLTDGFSCAACLVTWRERCPSLPRRRLRRDAGRRARHAALVSPWLRRSRARAAAPSCNRAAALCDVPLA